MVRKWDETREKVGVDAFEGASFQAQCDFLEICVSSMRVIVKWEGWPAVCADLVCPPVAVTSSSAAHLHSALWRHPVIADLIEDLRVLQDEAEYSFESHEVDGASGNDKLHWYCWVVVVVVVVMVVVVMVVVVVVIAAVVVVVVLALAPGMLLCTRSETALSL